MNLRTLVFYLSLIAAVVSIVHASINGSVYRQTLGDRYEIRQADEKVPPASSSIIRELLDKLP